MVNSVNNTISPDLKNANGRIVWVDIFRAIMIFAIAWGHSLGVQPLPSAVILDYVYSFHVPAFFFISGYLYSNSDGTFSSFLTKKIKTLMVPYYVFSLLSIAIFSLLGNVASSGLGIGVKSTDIFPNICGMLYANGDTGYMKWNLPLWFIPCLFCTTLLFYLIRRVIFKLSKPIGVNGAISSVLILIFIIAILNYYVLHFARLPFGLETAVYMLPFFIVGYWFKSLVDLSKIRAIIKVLIGVVCVVAGAIIALCFQGHINYTTSSYENIILFYISAFLTIIGYVMIVQFIKCKCLVYVGQNTLPILLMHKFPIILLQLILAKFIAKSSLIGVCITFVIAVLACVMSLFAGEIIKHIFPFMLGTKKKKRMKP